MRRTLAGYSAAMEPVLAGETVTAFARDGVACVRQVLDHGEAAAAAAAIDAVLASPGPLAQVASGACAARLAHLAALRRPGGRSPRRAAMDHPLFPVVWPT